MQEKQTTKFLFKKFSKKNVIYFSGNLIEF